MLSLVSSLRILDTNPLSDSPFSNLFFRSVGCLLVSSIVSFTVQRLFILTKCQEFIFAFVCLASGDVSRKKLFWPMSNRLLPVSSSRVLMVSCLTLRSFFHLEFIFLCQARDWSSFALLHVAVRFSQHRWLKRLSFFHWIFILLCRRGVDHIIVGPFLGFLFCAIGLCVCVCAATTLTWWPQLCNRAQNLESWCPQFCFSFPGWS